MTSPNYRPDTPAPDVQPGTTASGDRPDTSASGDQPGTSASREQPGTPAYRDQPGASASGILTGGSPAPDLRPIVESDWPAVWEIIGEVIEAGETFPYDPAMTAAVARDTWIERPPGLTVVAVVDGRVVGTAKMGANRPGPGAHVSTASFMVAATARGRGVGTALCRFAVDWARRQGFASMQFNAVVETNRSAVALYEREGFRVIGTVPRSFEHPTHGRVGLHVMYQEFTDPA